MATLLVHFKTQKIIFLLAIALSALFNFTFFSKLYTFALAEHNYIVALSAPFVLILLYIFAANVLLLFTHRLSFRIGVALLVFISALSSYFMDSFGTIIDKDMLINVLQTDSYEALSLITPKLILYSVLASVCAYWILFKVRIHFRAYTVEMVQKALVALVCFVLIGGVYMSVSKSYSSFFRNHKEMKMYLNPFFPIASFSKLLYAKLKPKPSFQAIATDAKRLSGEKKKLVVFIVGETARAKNFALGGYEAQTNPLLSKREDIVYLQNFSSCGTATAISLPCMFSKFERKAWDSDKEQYENLVDVLMKTGVRIIWRDNNSGKDKNIAKRINDVVHYQGKAFDEALLQDFQTTLAQNYEDTFVVLHQEGSHGPTYFQRYPEKFKTFTPTCDTQDLEKCSQEEIINTYNNTLVYTDYIIHQTLTLLKANEEQYETTLIYVSDHGESLGENGIYLHGLPYMIAPNEQKHVPALFYFSDKEKEKALHVKRKEPFSHDYLFHTIVSLFNIKTSEYKPSLDLLR
ncbi:phosphoethanolamine transferase [Sulfurospirillum barnesii]|uniref:Putative membrane-associated, metal-dependent hydrolase n=1 Tax=Sulfurospirillum barnesii (strain ATCC 700032 / DSM 10660 / SES-3) TaxID=760154 RepID=I3XZQ8_SULBS|nr:phosphoethanolamine--lipid A transferase [Sulfurospirillum barnesii]AFL69432.1 putative membrane-associated, metal-dependent hydrolase [Sulfurospirillum barnesii SES-3]